MGNEIGTRVLGLDDKNQGLARSFRGGPIGPSRDGTIVISALTSDMEPEMCFSSTFWGLPEAKFRTPIDTHNPERTAWHQQNYRRTAVCGAAGIIEPGN
ncbi:hypothetical protein BV911_14180 [Pseudoruegeria sp. SK021]|nr:hypothetical protein BV911_14180 [Pseudoruegeria sp. SK021]